MTLPESTEALRRHLDRAEQALMATAGGRSMCAIGRSGQSFPAAKYHEGAVSALAEVRRDARRLAGDAAETAAERVPQMTALAGAALAAWRDRSTRMATAGPDWRAYLAGGTEALEALIAELTGAAPAGIHPADA